MERKGAQRKQNVLLQFHMRKLLSVIVLKLRTDSIYNHRPDVLYRP